MYFPLAKPLWREQTAFTGRRSDLVLLVNEKLGGTEKWNRDRLEKSEQEMMQKYSTDLRRY